MSFNILDAAKGLFNSDLIGKASSMLGESESGITKAVGGVVPSVLTGLLSKAGGSDGGSGIFNMAKEAAGSGILNNLSGLLGGGGGMGSILNMAGSLFGDKLGGLAGLISNFAGIKNSSASSLLSMAAPAVLGMLGKHAGENNLSASGLSSLITSQKDNILKAVPSGLNLAGALGLGSLGDIGGKVTNMVSDTGKAAYNYAGDAADKAKGGMGKLLPWILVILAALAAWYFLKDGCNKPKTTDVTATVSTDTVNTTTTTAPETVSFKVKLPNGKELDALKGGIEDQLVTFLSGNWKALGIDSLKKIWFDFDNLNFETGKAVLLPESEKQLDNVAEILKAFPDAKIKIGGYTDAAGNAASNKKLSQERANAAKAGLEKRGTGKQVTGAEGYGSEFAKYPASAPDSDRVKDRHVSISIRM